MDHHVHLLATPAKIGACRNSDAPSSASPARPTGVPAHWEGCYEASSVDGESYVSHCTARSKSDRLLAPTPQARAEAHRQLLHETLPDEDLKAIQTYLQQRQALGRYDFCAMVGAKTQPFASVRPGQTPPRQFKRLRVNLTSSCPVLLTP